MTANDQTIALPLRSQTLLGVCEAIGEDFGFNANFLRVALGAIVVFNIWAAVGAYLALGLAVLASRLLFPVKSATTAAEPHSAPTPANNQIESQIAA